MRMIQKPDPFDVPKALAPPPGPTPSPPRDPPRSKMSVVGRVERVEESEGGRDGGGSQSSKVAGSVEDTSIYITRSCNLCGDPMSGRFEWSRQKDAENRRKHGVSFAEAAEVFLDPHVLIEYDDAHSVDEDRYNLIGMSGRLRILFVVTTERGETDRIISARRVTREERERYEAHRSR